MKATVEVEEVVCSFEPADNGAGPLWCHGSTVVARHGKQVYAAGLETLPDQQPLNNCRWVLYRRGGEGEGWQIVHRDTTGRTREPSPVAVLGSGDLMVSANPTLAEPGTRGGAAEPAVFRFDADDPSAAAGKELPVWSGSPAFSEHSYRTFVGDRAAAEVLYMQNVGYDVAHMSLLGRDGRWQGVGELKWPWGGEYPKPQPLRLCYPNVIMRNRAAHFFGVGDIVEPIEEWREEKHRITGRDWDYVFRRLFYATTPDVSTQPFGAWVEIANFDATAGSTRNCDIWVAPDGSVHLLWVQTNIDARLRDRFFPGEKIRHSMEYAVMRQGKVESQRALIAAAEGEEGATPNGARFHETESGKLLVLAQLSHQSSAAGGIEYRLADLSQEGEREGITWIEVPFREPMGGTFLTNSGRGGSAPSCFIDMIGMSPSEANSLQYARVRVDSGD